MATKDQLEAEVVRLLRSLRHADRERHTVRTRDLADAMVALREHYLTPEGQPDWTGRTWSYRDAVRTLYAAADYTSEERSSTQSTVRYHIGNLIRNRLSTSELAAAGMMAPSPHERQAARRQRASAILASLMPSANGHALPGTVEGLREALAFLAAQRIDKREISSPENAEAAAAIVRLLEAIRDRSATLLDEIDRSGV